MLDTIRPTNTISIKKELRPGARRAIFFTPVPNRGNRLFQSMKFAVRSRMEIIPPTIKGNKSLEDLPEGYINKYFEADKLGYKIKEEVKKCVEFRQMNLLKDDFPSQCDLIVCRNVLIYFTEEAKAEIYTKFNKSLKNLAFLFVGSTEQILQSNKYNFKSIRTDLCSLGLGRR